MPEIWRSLYFGGSLRLSDIPGAPTVGRDAAGRWTKLKDDIVRMYKEAAADGVNSTAIRVAHRSMREVPKEDGDLAKSIRYPGNDAGSEALPDSLRATVSYDTPYAAAQHEGLAVMIHHHPIIPGKKGFFEDLKKEAEITIEWKVKHHTVPGTKDHFLSDPLREVSPLMEGIVYRKVREKFAELGVQS